MKSFKARGSILCLAAAAALTGAAYGQSFQAPAGPGGFIAPSAPVYQLKVNTIDLQRSGASVDVAACLLDGTIVKSESQSDGSYLISGGEDQVKLILNHSIYGEAVLEVVMVSNRAVNVIDIAYVDGRPIVMGVPTLTGASNGGAPVPIGVCPGGGGDCCANNGSPGCDDVDCCGLICGLDPFCCDTTWDQLCADAALINCESCMMGGGDCGNCNMGGNGVGCSDPVCEALVCGADPFCCDTAWDSLCDGAAEDLCDCGGGMGSDCCIDNGTPGCDDPDCQAAVCAADPFCCDVAWDGLCAGAAEMLCEVCGGAPPTCEACLTCPPGASDEGETCLNDGDVDTTNAGCNGSPVVFTESDCGATWCGEVSTFVDGASGLQSRDTDWYRVVTNGGPIVASLTSEFPGVVFIVDGLGTCSPVVAGVTGFSDDCGAGALAMADLPPGEYAVFVSTGNPDGSGIFDGFPCGVGCNAYSLTIDCTTGGCESDDDCPPGLICDNGVCVVPPATNDDGNDATALDVGPGGSVDILGTTTTATIDLVPPCGTSVTAPGVWYSVIGNGNTMTASTCNQANYDTKITVFCGSCGDGGGGSDCCISNGTPGCDDPECEATICGLDPFCCDTSWDGICAGAAADLCEVCMAGDDGLICIDGIDDTGGCGGFTTELSWCAQAGAEYLILIHGFGGAVGDFTLTVSDNGAPCTPTVECIPAVPDGACCQCDGSTSFCTIETEEDCAMLGGLYLGDGSSCSAGGEQFEVSASPNAAIPDNDAAGASSTIDMGMSFAVADLEVSVDVSHTWMGDVCVTLSKDGGPAVALIQRMGLEPDTCGPGSCCGCSSNDFNVTLDDQAADSIEDQCADNLTGTYSPAPGSLAGFVGGDSAGAWTLTVSDGAGADTGTFNSWSLIFTQPAGGPSPCEAAFPCASIETLIIKQGACPAPFNPGSNGVTPMVLVGSADFDVNLVDVSSLALSRCDGVGGSVAPNDGPPGPPGAQIGDINHPNPVPATCETGGCTCNDDNSSDGIDDLKLKFNSDEMADVLELDSASGIITLVLSGSTTDGGAFLASDCVSLVGGPNPPGMMTVLSDDPVFIETVPLDVNWDGGGYPNASPSNAANGEPVGFTRGYTVGTIVNVTAPATNMDGMPFQGWVVTFDGVQTTFGPNVPTLQVAVGTEGTLEAVYAGPQQAPAAGPGAAARN